MTLTSEELTWIISGIALIVFEFILPGMVSVFLGSAAIGVGLMIHYHVIHGVAQSFGAWFGLSTFLILTVRQIAAKFFLSDSEYKYTEEDDAAIGEIVEVSETIHSEDSKGRIRFQGTDWPARTLQGTIRNGSRAVIKYRDNISWVVEIAENKN
jgi:membrane protein implicated in regulation of membrane protease activity